MTLRRNFPGRRNQRRIDALARTKDEKTKENLKAKIVEQSVAEASRTKKTTGAKRIARTPQKGTA